MADLTQLAMFKNGPRCPVIVMRLYCDTHEKVHELPVDDVERLVYAALGGERAAYIVGASDPELGMLMGLEKTECPLAVIGEWSREPEMGLAFVEKCIDARETSTDCPEAKG